MSPRRLYAPVVLLTLAAGGAAFFMAGRTWTGVDIAANGLPADFVAVNGSVTVSGSAAEPLVPALALVVVASALAVLAASARVRIGVGVLLLVTAVAAIVIVLTGGSALDDAVRRAVEDSPAFTGGSVPDGRDDTAWPFATIGAFAVAAVCGLLVLRLGPSWPTMGRRFEAPGARAERPVETEADMWKALDEGHDPTQ